MLKMYSFKQTVDILELHMFQLQIAFASKRLYFVNIFLPPFFFSVSWSVDVPTI